MSYLVWNDSFDVHLDHLNLEHQELFRLVNLLYQQKVNRESKTTMRATLFDFVSFTVEHFQDEERYMQEINYPELESHRLMHQRLLTKLKEFITRFEQDEGDVSEEFLTYIKMWLSSHIKGIDKKYSIETVTE